MIAVFDDFLLAAARMLRIRWRAPEASGACDSCGVYVEKPLTVCLKCLGERHW